MISKNKKVQRTINAKSANGIPFTVEVATGKDYGGRQIEQWSAATEDGEYIDMASNSIGSFHSLSLGSLESPEAFAERLATYPVLKGVELGIFGKLHLRGLYLECDISQEDFDAMMENAQEAMRMGHEVHYNDEHGVGHFEQTGDGEYRAVHCRCGTAREDPLDFDGIKEFLREFFRIGYSLHRDW